MIFLSEISVNSGHKDVTDVILVIISIISYYFFDNILPTVM